MSEENQASEVIFDRGETSPQREPIDWSVLAALKVLQRPGKTDFRRRLIDVYLSSMPAVFEKAQAAVKSLDGQALMKAAHSLKSSSWAIGAMTFGNTCRELEQIGKNNLLKTTPAYLQHAEQEFIAVCSALTDALEQNR